jgi:hypothetical protein
MDYEQVFILTLVAICVIYILPAIIAVWRGHPLRWPLAAANILLGWTLVGYAICLVVAVWPRTKISREW